MGIVIGFRAETLKFECQHDVVINMLEYDRGAPPMNMEISGFLLGQWFLTGVLGVMLRV